MQLKPLTMRAAGPLKSRICVLHPQADHAQTVCIPARDKAWAGRTVCTVNYFRPSWIYKMPSTCLLLVFLFLSLLEQIFLISYLSLIVTDSQNTFD